MLGLKLATLVFLTSVRSNNKLLPKKNCVSILFYNLFIFFIFVNNISSRNAE